MPPKLNLFNSPRLICLPFEDPRLNIYLHTGWPDKHGRVFIVPCKMWIVQCTLLWSIHTLASLFTKRPFLSGRIVPNACLGGWINIILANNKHDENFFLSWKEVFAPFFFLLLFFKPKNFNFDGHWYDLGDFSKLVQSIFKIIEK